MNDGRPGNKPLFVVLAVAVDDRIVRRVALGGRFFEL